MIRELLEVHSKKYVKKLPELAENHYKKIE